jgi:transmembrane serine protease 3
MAKLILVLIALTASFTAAFGQQCGTSAQMRPNRRYDPEGQRIVGGVEARPGSHPWIVSLQNGESHFCGGTLVRGVGTDSSDIVITAAHCVADGAPDRIVAGAHDHNRPASGQQSSRPSKVISHSGYDAETTMNDIAFIKLEKPIKFTSTIQPACLPSASENLSETTMGTVAGWGLTREGGYDTSSVLMQVGVPVISANNCDKQYRSQGIRIDSSAMLCAGYGQGGKDACQGDSGGPFVFKNPSGGYTLQGVVSFGVGCARPGLPGVYSKVSNYVSWINTNIKQYSRA